MIITTTPTVEGRRIREYKGVVCGEAVLGANVFRDLFAGIRDIVGGRSASYEKELRRARQIAFDDMLYNLFEALEGGRFPGLAATLRARYPAALIDEFQDTDPLQFAIFRRIYVDAAAETSLFLVGDPKQAIYSFRNADLPTYLAAKALAGRRYTLAHNQRSSPELIAACNALFSANPAVFAQERLDYLEVAAGAKPRAAFVGAGQRKSFDRRAHRGQRVFQFVRDVGGEPLDAFDAVIKRIGHGAQRARQMTDLVAARGEVWNFHACLDAAADAVKAGQAAVEDLGVEAAAPDVILEREPAGIERPRLGVRGGGR